MTTRKSPKPKRRFRDLGELARQANHVVAAAVFVFMASILLQFVLAKPFIQAAGWIYRHWGTAGAAIFGPLLTDGCTTLVLLGIAFPFGRVTAARPWSAGVALVVLVHGFWLSFHYVVGEHRLLWGHLMPVLGRSVLIVLTLLGVVSLLRWGRRVALVADGVGQRKPGKEAGPESESVSDREGAASGGESGAGAADPQGSGGAESGDPGGTPGEPGQQGSETCKDPASGDVSGGER